MNHFTNKAGWNSIRSARTWCFQASSPPPASGHPVGAYFTTLRPDAPNLATRLGLPRAKVAYLFAFSADDGLVPLRGGRGAYVFYSKHDYLVAPERQLYEGPSKGAP